MRLKIIALSILAALSLGFLALSGGVAGAWKCEFHPEQPTCTTLPPESTTSVPDTVPSTSVPVTSTTTSTSVLPPVELAPPVSIVRPPAPPRLAG
jgi:hypothetical protein